MGGGASVRRGWGALRVRLGFRGGGGASGRSAPKVTDWTIGGRGHLRLDDGKIVVRAGTDAKRDCPHAPGPRLTVRPRRVGGQRHHEFAAMRSDTYGSSPPAAPSPPPPPRGTLHTSPSSP